MNLGFLGKILAAILKPFETSAVVKIVEEIFLGQLKSEAIAVVEGVTAGSVDDFHSQLQAKVDALTFGTSWLQTLLAGVAKGMLNTILETTFTATDVPTLQSQIIAAITAWSPV